MIELATDYMLTKDGLRVIVAMPLSEGDPILMREKDNRERVGSLNYRPWPSSESSLYPGLLDENEEWHLILTDAKVFML